MAFRMETKGGQMYKYTYVYFEKIVLFLLRFVNPKSDPQSMHLDVMYILQFCKKAQ